MTKSNMVSDQNIINVNFAATAYNDTMIYSVDWGNKVMRIFMVLSKAFDSIAYQTLLDTLETLGVVGIALKWYQ